MERTARVIIVGGGFGGLEAAKALAGAPVHITLIDRSNHFIFQPLLYQVATAGLSPADISMPIRSILRRRSNLDVLMAEVQSIDPKARIVRHSKGELSFDYLIIATGAAHSYFGREEWADFAPGLKTIEDAVHIRRRILLAFENAEMERDPDERKRRLTFAIVGGGPTGVELAGAIAELARRTLVRDFTHIRPESAQVVLIEAGPRLLSSFPEKLSNRAKRDLERLGVDVRLGSQVVDIGSWGVRISGTEELPAKTVLWAAGVQAGGAARWLDVPADRSGRVIVDHDLSVPAYPDVFVIGDGSFVEGPDGKPLPGVAQPAIQQGRYVADVLRRRVQGKPGPPAFRYKDKGNMATIGRSAAVFHRGRIQFGGRFAWLGWLLLHIVYLIGFRNRLIVLIQWGWAYLTWERGARLITPIEKPDESPRGESIVDGPQVILADGRGAHHGDRR